MSEKKTIRKKMELEPGRKYRGSGMINEFGEVIFTAYQQGNAAPNAMKRLTGMTGENAQWGIYTSKDLLSVRITITKNDTATMQRELRNLFVSLITKLELYEI